MDYDLIHTALIIIGGVLVYALLSRGLFRMTDACRQKALEQGEKLCHSAQVDGYIKGMVFHRLGEVYSPLQAWNLALHMILVVVVMPFRRIEKVDEASRLLVPAHLQGDLRRFRVNWMVATVGNSPAAAVVFSFLLIMTLAFSASVSAISAALAVERRQHTPNHC